MDICLLNIILTIGIIGGLIMLYLSLRYFTLNKTHKPLEYIMMQKMAGND